MAQKGNAKKAANTCDKRYPLIDVLATQNVEDSGGMSLINNRRRRRRQDPNKDIDLSGSHNTPFQVTARIQTKKKYGTILAKYAWADCSSNKLSWDADRSLDLPCPLFPSFAPLQARLLVVTFDIAF
jgi:hypothetical protein